MRITPNLFEAFLKCETKCWLRASGESPSGNTYAEWVQTQGESYREAQVKRLLLETLEGECLVSPSVKEMKGGKWRLAVKVAAQEPECHPPVHTEEEGGNEAEDKPQQKCMVESHIHAIERVPPDDKGKAVQCIPIRFIFINKLGKDDKLMLAFDAHALSKSLKRSIGLGKIIHGDKHATRRIKLPPLATEVQRSLTRISEILSSSSPPDLVLNRHCAECEFQSRCRRIAEEKDDLSLLARMNGKERKKLNSKGIFTVTQLSYTFRPRRRPKKMRDKPERYHHSLKALAIRENKIHIVGSPELKIEGTPVYLDVEGLPDRDFYYLIGLRVGDGESAVHHSLWADTVEDEGKIWQEFLGVLENVENPILIHYGNYETIFFKRMSERYGNPPSESVAEKAIASACNLVSVIFAKIYFPTYSNGLKEIATYLGFNWASDSPSGVQTVAWRAVWENSMKQSEQMKLVSYNAEDCEALSLLTDRVGLLVMQLGVESSAQLGDSDVVHADAEQNQQRSKWKAFASPIDGFEEINAVAHWDYYRDRVYARFGKPPKKVSPHRSRKITPEQAQLVVVWPASPYCPNCQRKVRSKATQKFKTVHDIVFGRHSLKRRVVKHVFRIYHCRQCRIYFGMPNRFRLFRQYGWNLVVHLFFQLIELNIPQRTVVRQFNRLFDFDLSTSTFNNMKVKVVEYYSETVQKILNHIVQGGLVHADETRANIQGQSGFVWVLTSNSEVVYIFADSREGEMIQLLLEGFGGVLVSDFYTAYNSIDCPHQRCLIHLMRDLNDDVLNNPFDTELRQVVTAFAELLKEIVETVDRFGLKKYYLKKHLTGVERFYRMIREADCHSEVANKCKERFERNRNELFTFLSHDGIPWHNNAAEHAIKAFARLRVVIAGSSTEKGVKEYLTLLSICQTCKYMGVDFLDFLRSGEKDIHAFAESQRRRK
ncbi:MAG: IS66 family transposase [Kiritimatiellales bacterium]|nr:IS66 family transposase [Kiritimatiellales bacterium]